MPRRFAVAAWLAGAVLVLGALAGRMDPRSNIEWVPWLGSAALLCVALLLRQRAPSLTWPCLVLSAAITAAPPSLPRGPTAGTLPPDWLLAALIGTAAVGAAALIAGLYATRPQRRLGEWVVPVSAVAVGSVGASCLMLVLLGQIGVRAAPGLSWSDLLILPAVLASDVILVLFGLGVAAEITRAEQRADIRLASRIDAGALPTRGDRLRATLDELVPGAAQAHDAAVHSERVRLAGDLHAAVLPELRRAMAAAEAGGSVEALADGLRSVNDELERLMTDRWPILLESFGLLEALEELAERAEEGGLAVTIDVAEQSGRPPRAIERAAYAVGQVALDNVLRHASASTVLIVVAVRPDRVRLGISDNGTGLDTSATAVAARAGRMGLTDLARRADAVGGAVRIGRRADGRAGTEVVFDWPTAQFD